MRAIVSISGAAVDERAISGCRGNPLGKALPHRHAPKAFVKKDERRRSIRPRPVPFIFKLLILNFQVRHFLRRNIGSPGISLISSLA